MLVTYKSVCSISLFFLYLILMVLNVEKNICMHDLYTTVFWIQSSINLNDEEFKYIVRQIQDFFHMN